MLMVLLMHIIIALASVILASITLFKPATRRFYASYGLILATVASGTYLLVATSASILHTCLSGLCYVTVVSILTVAAHVRARRVVTVRDTQK